MKTPKFEDIVTPCRPTLSRNGPTKYYSCNFCGAELTAWYDQKKPIRAHMLRKHRMEYYATVEYIINEEADHLWSVAR